jgi:hypothetical protein
MADEEQFDYFETVQLLNRWAGEKVYITPAPDTAGRTPSDAEIDVSALGLEGTLKALDDKDAKGAALRRELSDMYERIDSELALGDAPLELYERQVAWYGFEGMDVPAGRVMVTLWQHEFIEARLLDSGTRYDWLWINLKPSPLYILRELTADELAARLAD